MFPLIAACVQDSNLPLQHQQPGTHLSGCSQGPVESGAHHLQGVALGDQSPGRL